MAKTGQNLAFFFSKRGTGLKKVHYRRWWRLWLISDMARCTITPMRTIIFLINTTKSGSKFQPHGLNFTLIWTQSRKRSRISDVSSDYKELMWSICAGDNDIFSSQCILLYNRTFIGVWKSPANVQYWMLKNVSVFMAVENGDIGMLKSLGIKVELLSQSLNLWVCLWQYAR